MTNLPMASSGHGEKTYAMSPRSGGAGNDSRTRRSLSSQDAPERAANDGPTDRPPHRAADRSAEIGVQLSGDAIGHRARYLPRHQLSRGQPLAAPAGGAEDTAEHGPDAAEPPPCLPFRRRDGRSRRRRIDALFQDLIGRFRIDRRIVFSLHRALRDDGAALLGADGTQTRRWRTD